VARPNKPWFRSSKNAWFATIDGRKVPLGVRGAENKADAERAWHCLMAGGSPITPASTSSTVAEAVDLFLADARTRTKTSTHDLYERHLGTLTDRLGGQRLATISTAAVGRWLNGLGVGETTRAIMLRSASAFFGWCTRHGMVAKNPVRAVAKPKSRSRGGEVVISDEDHKKLVAVATPRFRLVLSILQATGARPGEVCRITAENFDPDAGLVKIAEHKSDRSGRFRLVLLSSDAVTLLKEQRERFPTGPLLRNRLGRLWTPKAIAGALAKLRVKAGVTATAYGYRHGFATRALAAGVPDAHVAALLGHSSTAMLHRHYAHLTSQTQTLRGALSRISG
jgi:integrase/recombinase XerC